MTFLLENYCPKIKSIKGQRDISSPTCQRVSYLVKFMINMMNGRPWKKMEMSVTNEIVFFFSIENPITFSFSLQRTEIFNNIFQSLDLRCCTYHLTSAIVLLLLLLPFRWPCDLRGPIVPFIFNILIVKSNVVFLVHRIFWWF